MCVRVWCVCVCTRDGGVGENPSYLLKLERFRGQETLKNNWPVANCFPIVFTVYVLEAVPFENQKRVVLSVSLPSAPPPQLQPSAKFKLIWSSALMGIWKPGICCFSCSPWILSVMSCWEALKHFCLSSTAVFLCNLMDPRLQGSEDGRRSVAGLMGTLLSNKYHGACAGARGGKSWGSHLSCIYCWTSLRCADFYVQAPSTHLLFQYQKMPDIIHGS